MSDIIDSLPRTIGPNEDGYNPYRIFNPMIDPYTLKNNLVKDVKDTELNSGYFLFRYMDIPERLVKKVEFLSEYKFAVTFREIAEFSVELYFKRNFDVLTGKKLTIEYLTKEGKKLRTDTYQVSKIVDVLKGTLDIEEEKPLEIKIVFECTNHDISTCTE